ncbi:MAG: ABC transporter ATP-binding protein [Lachnospiraceae bacterium]|nr:ABC transporter ATP-binding protein [Lachnospiraceae bacterium]
MEYIMVRLEQVSKRMGTFLLKDITMELPEGYIMGLIGPNGAGKTTLLHLIMGLLELEDGRIEVMGKEFLNEEHAIRDDMGVVLQERLFQNRMTLQENAAFYGRYYKNYDEVYLKQLLKRFELEPERRYKKLSKGEELKFQFAFALAHHPRLLILDEPTGNFDPDFREEFFKALKEFIADGSRSVILATHLTEDLDRFADYITYLDKGKLLFSQDIESLKEGFRLLSGETYKINLLPKENIIYMEKGEFGTRALIQHRRRFVYDKSLRVSYPTIEELMYFVTKGGKPC